MNNHHHTSPLEDSLKEAEAMALSAKIRVASLRKELHAGLADVSEKVEELNEFVREYCETCRL